MHIGLLGTMSQMFLSDLRAKTTRGLRFVTEDRRSAGGRCYGYRVAVPVHTSQAQRGHRAIHESEAHVVRRIFRDYGVGLSPKRIAHALNAEGIPSPRGGAWAPSAINGSRNKGTGILNNELYLGRQVWGRQTWLKDPSTGRRMARTAAPDAQVITEVPELRIIEDELWGVVKARQAVLEHNKSSPGEVAPFWARQRPRYLFSGLMRCGASGGGFSKISAAHFGCSTARNQGKTVCTNRLTLRHDRLEREVLGALQHRLMDPELFRVFVLEFTAEWNRLQAEASAGQTALRQELERVERQLAKLVDALMEGVPAVTVRERMATLEARKLVLQDELASAVAPAPRLHPGLAQLYRDRVAELTRVLSQDDAAEARELIRGLVEEIRLVPEDDVLRIEVRGALGAILALAKGALQASLGTADGPPNAKRPDLMAGVFVEQVKLDAGTRNRRSQYIAVAI